MHTNDDKLDILRRRISDVSVDLIYVDLPLNATRDHSIIIREESWRMSDAHLLAFEDTGHWSPSAEATCACLTNTPATNAGAHSARDD